MKELLSGSAFFGVVLSLLAYRIGVLIKKKWGLALLNPILIAVALTIGALLLLGIDYDHYYASAKYLSYLLTPTTVCLAIPLYEQLRLLKAHALAITLGIAAGVLASLGSILLQALLLHMPEAQTMTLLPKSITTAIGVPLCETLGGYPSITAVVIILTGIVGNVLAEGFLKLLRVTHPIARGIAIGTSAHAIGTAKAIELGEIEGAMSGLSIAVSGLMTVAAISIVTML